MSSFSSSDMTPSEVLFLLVRRVVRFGTAGKLWQLWELDIRFVFVARVGVSVFRSGLTLRELSQEAFP